MKFFNAQTFMLLASMVIYSAVSAQNSDFKPSGTLSGYVFGDYYWKAHGDSLGRGGKNVQYSSGGPSSATPSSTGNDAFQIRRAYLAYDYNLTSNLSASMVLANEQNLDGSGQNTTYLKYMYVKWANIFKNSNLIFGQMPTPSFAMSPFGTEPLWGYRSIERTLLDMHNVDGSSDLGIALQGYLWKGKVANDTIKPDIIGYEIMVGNGNSAKPETDIFKKFRGTVYVGLLQQKLNFGIYADYNRVSLVNRQDNKTFKIYADYKTRVFRIGAEIFEQINADQDEITVNKNNYWTNGVQDGWSIFLSGKILKDLNFYARLDQYNPDTKYNNNDTYKTTAVNTATYKQTFTTLGLDYTVTKRIHIMPNLWYNKYDSQLANVHGKAKSDYDLVPRLTFYVVFNSSKSIQNNGMDN